MLAGTAIFLYRRYHETGRIGRTEIIASVITLVIGAAIVVLIVRWANRRG